MVNITDFQIHKKILLNLNNILSSDSNESVFTESILWSSQFELVYLPALTIQMNTIKMLHTYESQVYGNDIFLWKHNGQTRYSWCCLTLYRQHIIVNIKYISSSPNSLPKHIYRWKKNENDRASANVLVFKFKWVKGRTNNETLEKEERRLKMLIKTAAIVAWEKEVKLQLELSEFVILITISFFKEEL